MVLKLSGHVRNTISLLYMQKTPGEIPIFGTFLAKKVIFCQFWSMFTENPLFESGHAWKRHCDAIRWPIFMNLVSMEREDPTLYHGTKQSYFRPVNFKFIRGVVTPLVNHVTKKGLVGRGLKLSTHAQWCQKTPFCLKLSTHAQKSVLSWSISMSRILAHTFWWRSPCSLDYIANNYLISLKSTK